MSYNGINYIHISNSRKKVRDNKSEHTPLNDLDNDDNVLTNEKDVLERWRIEFENM